MKKIFLAGALLFLAVVAALFIVSAKADFFSGDHQASSRIKKDVIERMSAQKEEEKASDQEEQEPQEKPAEIKRPPVEEQPPKKQKDMSEDTKAESNGHIVVIDPGHQRQGDSHLEPNGPGSRGKKARVTGGTRGTQTGIYEYELNLTIGLALREELEARGYTVYMTRETHDVNISNMERAKFANEKHADISVRIHANGAENHSAKGACVLVPSASNRFVSDLAGDSKRLGQKILSCYCDATGMVNQGIQENDTMTGINWCEMPVAILEMGYMTNAKDDVNMSQDDFQKKMVQGIANGIDQYFE